jgi:hypothetical protein
LLFYKEASVPATLCYRFTILTQIVAEDYKTTHAETTSFRTRLARQILPEFGGVAVIKTQKVLVVATIRFTDPPPSHAVDGAAQAPVTVEVKLLNLSRVHCVAFSLLISTRLPVENHTKWQGRWTCVNRADVYRPPTIRRRKSSRVGVALPGFVRLLARLVGE